MNYTKLVLLLVFTVGIYGSCPSQDLPVVCNCGKNQLDNWDDGTNCGVTCMCGGSNGWVVNNFDFGVAVTECGSGTWSAKDGVLYCDIDCADGFRSQSGEISGTVHTNTCSECASLCDNNESCFGYDCSPLFHQCSFTDVEHVMNDDAIDQANLFCARETTSAPTVAPTQLPSSSPSVSPSYSPTAVPSYSPTVKPTSSPSHSPSASPSYTPTSEPTNLPTAQPITSHPSASPTTSHPSASPTNSPSQSPVVEDGSFFEQFHDDAVEVLPEEYQDYWYAIYGAGFFLLSMICVTLYCCLRKKKSGLKGLKKRSTLDMLQDDDLFNDIEDCLTQNTKDMQVYARNVEASSSTTQVKRTPERDDDPLSPPPPFISQVSRKLAE